MHAAFVFLDGVGLGPPGPANVFSTLHLRTFERLAGGQPWTFDARAVALSEHVFRPLDACLGVEGLPQSGTGQTALFTGENAAALFGRHYGPTPPIAAHGLLGTHSLWRRLLDAGVPAPRLAFLNAYPDRFFHFTERTGRWSTTTRMARAAGVPLRAEDALRAGQALAADLTGEGWRELLGLDVPLLTPRDAGRRLHALARERTATLFEFFLTDKAGHARDPDRAAAVLRALDTFFAGYLEAFEPARDLLVVSSDHGNLEDLGVKTHTRNAVPLVAVGRGAEAFAHAGSLLDVTPTLVSAVVQSA